MAGGGQPLLMLSTMSTIFVTRLSIYHDYHLAPWLRSEDL